MWVLLLDVVATALCCIVHNGLRTDLPNETMVNVHPGLWNDSAAWIEFISRFFESAALNASMNLFRDGPTNYDVTFKWLRDLRNEITHCEKLSVGMSRTQRIESLVRNAVDENTLLFINLWRIRNKCGWFAMKIMEGGAIKFEF
jgi:hypothetical protein